MFDALDLTDRVDGGGKREKVKQAVLVASPGELPRLVSALIELLFERGFLETSEENAEAFLTLRDRSGWDSDRIGWSLAGCCW